MAVPVKPTLYEQLLALPDNVVGQILNGELVALPRPAIPHQRAAWVLSQDLSGPYDRGRNGPGGWWFLHETEVHLGDDVLVPDLAGWRRDRLPSLPRAPYMTLAPDWVCEVLSPSTMGIDRVRKLRIYARERVRHYWMIDPEARTFEVFRLRDVDHQYTVAATHAGDALVRAEPFDQMDLDLGTMWLTPSKG